MSSLSFLSLYPFTVAGEVFGTISSIRMLYVLLMLLVVAVDSVTLKQFIMCMHGMHV